MLRKFAGTLTVAAAMLAFPAFANAQDTTAPVSCSGTISKQIIKGDVTVPRGASCTLDRVIVRGNVTPARRATGLSIVDGSLVTGNVDCAECGDFTLDRALVRGTVTVAENAGSAKVCSSVVNGAVSITFTPVVTLGDGTSACRGSAFVADVAVQYNNGDVKVSGNALNANLTVDANTGATISRNVIRGNVACEFNEPAPTLTQNVVLGESAGQCAPAAA